MLLQAAMAELRNDSPPSVTSIPNNLESLSPPLQTGKAENMVVESHNNNIMSAKESQSHSRTLHIVNRHHHHNEESSLFKDDHSKEGSSDDFTSSNAGSSFSTSFCDDSSNEGMSLLQDDNDFVSKVLNREPSNLGESSRFGSYRSTMAAGGVAFQWEAEPGKCKNPKTIQEEEEEQVLPLSLPPIRLTAVHVPPYRSPSSSTMSSPRSITGKVKSLLINHVKKPSMDHFSFSNILENQKSPSKKSPPRAKKGRRASSLSASGHASLTSSPYNYNYASNLIRNGTNMQRNEELYAPRDSLNSSDPSSSPYYFSPLSNTSSYMSHDTVSPRMSAALSMSGSTASVTHPQSGMGGSHASSRGSDSSISSISSAVNAPMKAPSMLANCLLTITSMSDNTLPPSESENRDHHVHQNGKNPLSFASPEMEVLEEGLLTSANHTMVSNKWETSMADFINRGGPSMNRSLSVSRVTFADDLYRRPAQKSKYYSAQLNNQAQPKGTHFSPTPDSIHYSPNLDVLFPLKRPNMSGNLAPIYANQSDNSSDDRQAYMDALDTSLDCSVLTDNEELNSMVQSIMKDLPTKNRPAQEVVMQANDENGFAYSPVALAFVFSPRQNAAKQYFKPSTRANIGTDQLHASMNGGIIKDEHHNVQNYGMAGQPKSILKKPSSGQLYRTKSLSAKGAGEVVACNQYMQQSKSLSHSGSQKISSVLLRFAEAEEQLYNSTKRHHQQQQNGLRSPACMQPVCSFLGRALLCRSKLAGRLHSR